MKLETFESLYNLTQLAIPHTQATTDQLRFHNAAYTLFPEIKFCLEISFSRSEIIEILLKIRKMEKGKKQFSSANESMKYIDLNNKLSKKLKEAGLE